MTKTRRTAYLVCVSLVFMLSVQSSAEARDINLQVYPEELEPYEAIWIDLRMSECDNNTTMTLRLYSPASRDVWRVTNLTMPEGCAWKTSIVIEYEWDYGTYIVVADITAPLNATSNITVRSQRTETFEVVFGSKTADRLFRDGITEAVQPLVDFLVMMLNQFIMGLVTVLVLGMLLFAILSHKHSKRMRELSWWDRTFGRVGLKADPIENVVGRHSFAPKLRARWKVRRLKKKVEYIDKLLEDLGTKTWALKRKRAYIAGLAHVGTENLMGVSADMKIVPPEKPKEKPTDISKLTPIDVDKLLEKYAEEREVDKDG